MRFLAPLIILVYLSGCASLSEDKEVASIHMKIGQGYLQSGNYPQALSELLAAEKLNSGDPVIQNYLGLAYAGRDRLDLAEGHLRTALNLKPEYSEARNNLGRILTERGKYKEALIELQKVVDDLTYPSPDAALVNLGITRFKMGEYELAKKALQKSLELQRENCVGQSYYGRTFYELHDYRRAAETLDKAVGYCQRIQYDEPHYYSALSYYQLGEKRKSETRLEELIKLYPDGKYVEKAKQSLETMRK